MRNEFVEELRKTANNYIQHLPEVLKEIEESWHRLQKNLSDQHSYDELFRLIHNIGGSATLFGVPEIGDVIRKLEELLSATTNLQEAQADISANIKLLKQEIMNVKLV